MRGATLSRKQARMSRVKVASMPDISLWHCSNKLMYCVYLVSWRMPGKRKP